MAAVSHFIQSHVGGRFLTANSTPEEVFTREDLSAAQEMLGSVAEDFLRTEVFPRKEQLYAKDHSVTLDMLQKAGELDLLSLDVPQEYGGLGLDKVSSAHVVEKFGVAPSVAVPIMAHTGIGTLPIVYFGTEQQKLRYLPQLASGATIGAYALTEPGAGSDALSIRTRAKLSDDGRHYILNGQKMFITNGGFADVFTVFAKVDGEKFTAFIVEREMGVVSGPEESKLGLDGSSTTALFLENVRVPVENVLGEIGQGHKIAFNILNFGRLKMATLNMGGAKQALNDALTYAKERQQFGRAIATFGMIQQKLAEMAIRCYVGDAMAYRTVGDIDRTLDTSVDGDSAAVLNVIESFSAECSMNKVFSSEALAYVVDEALQTHGGYGYSKDYPAERAYRDARIARIYEGTNEINRVLIPIRLLKVPAVAAAAANVDVAGDVSDAAPFNHPLFAREYGLLASAKKFVLLALGSAAGIYGRQLSDEQELLGHLADVAMQTYALESALLRTSKMVAAKGAGNCSAPIDIARIYASDTADRVHHCGKQIIAALPASAETNRLPEMVSQLAHHPAFNAIAARRRIASVLVRAGRYPF
jgi:alkylation response protein AidB-like acyl-CoA dehydrogenase